MGGRIGVVPAREVPVVGGDDGVLFSHLYVLPVGDSGKIRRVSEEVLPPNGIKGFRQHRV